MLHPSTKRLIDKLIDMTASSKINWQEGDDNSCIYDTEGYRVMIGQIPSRMVLLDASGRVLETVSDAMLFNTRDELGEPYSIKIDLLVSTARRQITGATDVIDKLVSFLDGNVDAFPEPAPTEKEAAKVEVTDYPDHPEMKSRVAMLAESLKDHGVISSDDEDAASHAADEGDAWTVPEKAESGVAETVEDYVDENEPEAAGFTPLDITPLKTTSPAEDEDVNDGLPAVDRIVEPLPTAMSETETAAPLAAPEPVVHPSQSWIGVVAVDALVVTPAEYTTPLAIAPADELVSPAEPQATCMPDTSFSELSAAADDLITSEAPATDEMTDTSFDPRSSGGDAETMDTFQECSEAALLLSETEVSKEPEFVDVSPEPSVETVSVDVAETEPGQADMPTRRTVYKYNPWM